MANGSDTGSYYRIRTRNMALTVILVSIAPLLVVTFVILYEFRQAYEEKVNAHLVELVEKHKQNIDGFLWQRLGDIRVLAKTFSYDELSSGTFLGERLAALQQVYGPVFVDLGVVDAAGNQVAYAGPFPLVHANYRGADWFQRAMKSEFFVSDVFLGLRNVPHFIVAVRTEREGSSPWLLRATVDFVAFNALVESIRMGSTGFAFILNREGALQTTPYRNVPADRIAFLEQTEKAPRLRQGVRVVEQADASGRVNIYVAAYLNDGNWMLVYQQSARDAYSDVYETEHVTLAIIVLGILAIASTATVISRRLFMRIADADRQKEMMNEQMVETGKLASVGELAAGIAHEINNPVAIMVEEAGWIEDLLEDETFAEGENLNEFHRALLQIKNQGRRCKEITHKLLSFARKTDAQVEDVQINDLIEEVVSLSAQRAKYSNVTINTVLDEYLPRVRASLTELQQVFLNLINNALDAMEKKGGRIDITTQEDDDFVTVFVADNGPGIPRANLDRVFDPFFSTKPVGKGTGLGLSICYGIVKKMGGDITVRSVLDLGTTFRLRIPMPMAERNSGKTSGGETPES